MGSGLVRPRPLLDGEPRRTPGLEVKPSNISLIPQSITLDLPPVPPRQRPARDQPHIHRRTQRLNRGRDAGCPTPPAQIPACASNALGSCLGFWRQTAWWAKDDGSGVGVATDRRCGASAPTSPASAGCDAEAP
jgi:hypothetical protein